MQLVTSVLWPHAYVFAQALACTVYSLLVCVDDSKGSQRFLTINRQYEVRNTVSLPSKFAHATKLKLAFLVGTICEDPWRTRLSFVTVVELGRRDAEGRRRRRTRVLCVAQSHWHSYCRLLSLVCSKTTSLMCPRECPHLSVRPFCLTYRQLCFIDLPGLPCARCAFVSK